MKDAKVNKPIDDFLNCCLSRMFVIRMAPKRREKGGCDESESKKYGIFRILKLTNNMNRRSKIYLKNVLNNGLERGNDLFGFESKSDFLLLVRFWSASKECG